MSEMLRYHASCVQKATQGDGAAICRDCWVEACYMLNCTTGAQGVIDYIVSRADEANPAAANLMEQP